MSNAHQKPWSDNPNAPVILYGLYIYEKVSLAGNLVSSILYGTCKKIPPHDRLTLPTSSILGILIMVFFRSMAALFNPDNRRGEPIKWGLVSYTVVMFSVVTLGTAMQLDVQSISYIDNREFPGAKGMSFPGPLGYQWFILPEAISIIQNILFVLNNWLADGFLVCSLFDTAFTRPGV